MNIRIHKSLKLLLKIAITAIALYIVFRNIDVREILLLFGKSNPWWLLLALLAFILSQLLSSFRLNQFLKSVNINISEKTNFKLYLLGMFYNLFLPGGIGGDGYKIYLLNKTYNVKIGRLFWALIMDRLSGLVALVGIAAVLVYFVDVPDYIDYFIWLLVPLSALTFYLVIYYFLKHFVKIVSRIIGYSYIIQLLQVLSAFCILLAFGTGENYITYLFLFLVSSIVSSIPITVGGVGSREITFLYGAQFLQMNVNEAVGLSFMFYLITVIVSLCGLPYVVSGKNLLKNF
ncbi:MAG: lysylphosphatidylglycerol synthase transmembrane domain-containing protein [Bacteroidota bacterium]|nr:lysylphosphatidylglycerol synthase transmembrane domain-containing protein [Bacteroidota bacterium]